MFQTSNKLFCTDYKMHSFIKLTGLTHCQARKQRNGSKLAKHWTRKPGSCLRRVGITIVNWAIQPLWSSFSHLENEKIRIDDYMFPSSLKFLLQVRHRIIEIGINLPLNLDTRKLKLMASALLWIKNIQHFIVYYELQIRASKITTVFHRS